MNQINLEKIAVVGLWHQGLVAAACLADLGFDVTATDIDEKKVIDLSNGKVHIYEPGLEELINKSIKSKKLKFSSDLSNAVSEKNFVFLMFDTKVNDQDQTDLTDIFNAVEKFAKSLKNNCIIYNTSQVPVGTSEKLLNKIKKENPSKNLSIVYSPENLRLGEAIKLYLNPAMPVMGSDDKNALDRLDNLLKPLNVEWLKVDLKTAEFCKHALNSYLATTITFANELGMICDKIGADGFKVAKALRLEPRISSKSMLRPGMGFSGGTLARDVQTLRKLGDKYLIDTNLLDGLWKTNNYQNQFVFRKIKEILGNLKNKKICILGITYKPETSTLRRSVALETIKKLNIEGAKIKAHDPKADKRELAKSSGFDFFRNIDDAIFEAEVIAIMTGWKEYQNINWDQLQEKISSKIIIDCNNMFNNQELTSLGYRYICIGRGLELKK